MASPFPSRLQEWLICALLERSSVPSDDRTTSERNVKESSQMRNNWLGPRPIQKNPHHPTSTYIQQTAKPVYGNTQFENDIVPHRLVSRF